MISAKIIERAIKEAKKSTFSPRHGAVIFKGEKILSIGYNQIRYCSLLPEKYTRWKCSLHAEQKAIIYNHNDLRRCSILVIRLNNQNKLMNSKPCPLCLGLITDVGITNIYYSTNGGSIIKL